MATIIRPIIVGLAVGIIAAGPFILSHNRAQAESQATIYPGLNCKFYAPQNEDEHFDPYGHSANGLQNDSSSAKKLACPLVNTQANTFDGANFFKTRYARVRMSTSTGWCKLYVLNDSGDWGWWAHDAIVASSGGDSVYEVGDSNSVMNTRYGSLTLYCSVPSGAVVYNYSHNIED